MIEERREKIEEITHQRHEYNLLNADAIRRIADTQAILVSANKNPAIIETTPYFQHRKYARVPKRYGAAHLGNSQAGRTIKRVPLK